MCGAGSFVLWQWHDLWKHADQSLKLGFAIISLTTLGKSLICMSLRAVVRMYLKAT